jgi:hypothetical protein
MFDGYIFPPNYIKSYDFNIASRSFAIHKDFETQFEFPACIATLNDDHYVFGERPNVIQHHLGPSNVNQIPVLLNFENEHRLIVQEEQVQTAISVIINCESQLQAKDVEHRIKYWLPLSKWIQFLEFTSFLEVPQKYLETLDFKPHDHQILNLFMRMDKDKGEVDYCYSVRYKPHIRLENISTSIGDASQRSFPVNIEMNYLTQAPMFMFCDKLPGEIEAINIIYSDFGHDPIADYPVQAVLNLFSDITLEKDLGTNIPKRITSNGEWVLDQKNQGLYWKNFLTGEIFPVAEKPIEGVWELEVDDRDNQHVVWARTPTKKYYIDEDHNTIREDRPLGPHFLPKGQKIKIWDKPKMFIRRTLLVSDEGQLEVNRSDNSIIFCISFSPNDMKILPGYRYNFVDNQGNIHRDIPYLSLDEEKNNVCFEVTHDKWNEIKPSLTKPLIIQFLEERPTSGGGQYHGIDMEETTNG